MILLHKFQKIEFGHVAPYCLRLMAMCSIELLTYFKLEHVGVRVM